MKNIKRYINRILIVSAGVVLVACNKDFLEVNPKDQATDGSAWASTGNADLFLNNVYSSVGQLGIQGTNPTVNTINNGYPTRTEDPEDNRTDDGMGKPVNNSMTVYKKANYTPSSNNSPTYWFQYVNVRKANLFIEKLTASTLPADYKKLRIAEARFLRAYFYYLLWTHHGGVPIITDVLSIAEDGDAVFKTRNTDAETYKFIVDELAAIAPDLTNAQGKGRATRGAALTLKGTAEMFWASALKNTANDKARWAAAATSFKSVMALGTYSLHPDYEKLFFEEGEYSNEVIFDKAHIGGISTIANNRSGYQGPNMSAGGLELSWCGVNITQDMVDEYQMANGKSITDPTSGYDPQNPYVNREKRFYQSIVYDGSTWLGEEMVTRIGLASPNEVDLGSAGDNTDTGYYLKKGIEPKYAVSGPNNLSGANLILFRYAEVLLGYAEAQNEAASPDQSVYDAMKAVRARSGLPELPAGLTQAQMRDAIRHERRVELFWEEKRWYDLIRWKTAEIVLNGTSRGMKIEKVGGVWKYTPFNCIQGKMTFFANRNYLFPIPQSSRDRNTKLDQNPNY
jgi:hypothetical protein